MRWIGDRALQNLQDLVAVAEPGDVIDGRFELGQRIGEGGMGAVYAGVDQVTGREVAVKIVSLSAHHDEARFQREATALARAAHPAIVSYIAHGTHAGALHAAKRRSDWRTESAYPTSSSVGSTSPPMARVWASTGAPTLWPSLIRHAVS